MQLLLLLQFDDNYELKVNQQARCGYKSSSSKQIFM